jgi:hypothetical protein
MYQKKEKLKINNLSFHCKKLEKEAISYDPENSVLIPEYINSTVCLPKRYKNFHTILFIAPK